MNAYRIDIWRSVEHNGVFVVNNNRIVIIHAQSEAKAKEKVYLADKSEGTFGDLTIAVSSEYIYSCEKIGQVKIVPFYVYSGGYSPIPVSDYQQRLQKWESIKS